MRGRGLSGSSKAGRRVRSDVTTQTHNKHFQSKNTDGTSEASDDAAGRRSATRGLLAVRSIQCAASRGQHRGVVPAASCLLLWLDEMNEGVSLHADGCVIQKEKGKRGFLEGHAEVRRTRFGGGDTELHALVHGVRARVRVVARLRRRDGRV